MDGGAERFVRALERAERERKVEPLLEVFSDEAEVWSVGKASAGRGPEAVRRFWREYLDAFERVESRFKDVIAQDGHVALEWHSDGVLPGGKPIAYDGVSLIELEGDQVVRFRTYFDPRLFLGEEGSRGLRRGA
jgi:ketosteroid isomerase-like protein